MTTEDQQTFPLHRWHALFSLDFSLNISEDTFSTVLHHKTRNSGYRILIKVHIHSYKSLKTTL